MATQYPEPRNIPASLSQDSDDKTIYGFPTTPPPYTPLKPITVTKSKPNFNPPVVDITIPMIGRFERRALRIALEFGINKCSFKS
ncbi:hypothetical protein NPIL_302501 [Nephila pilipes]|uniref:Uncharacterized protein n=1 Tax=Nephila pilipes TaxID=299642 RepID=A0A8X6K3P2_NEPPI|nr:hypothetical protein NPIL_302501 [Nephila pilipes]